MVFKQLLTKTTKSQATDPKLTAVSLEIYPGAQNAAHTQ